jgi:hypothetical protein
MMEHWNIGMLGLIDKNKSKTFLLLIPHYSIIPTFHCSKVEVNEKDRFSDHR